MALLRKSLTDKRIHFFTLSGGGAGIFMVMLEHQNSLPTDRNSMFIRRLGPDPHANGAQTVALHNCPDIFELDNGDFAIIGIDITSLSGYLPSSAGCGPDERMVRIPRNLLVLAKRDIPDAP